MAMEVEATIDTTTFNPTETEMNIEDDEVTVISNNKRTLSQTTNTQEKPHSQEKPQENNERVTKKPFSSHGIRRAKRKVRFDFLNATTTTEAYEHWKKFLTVLRKIDTTTIIHTHEENIAIHITDALPKFDQAQPYMKLEEVKKRNGESKYGSITTMTLARPIHETKKLYPELVDVLMETNTFLKTTLLETTDTVEIGFFIGLHPSLTNIEWRINQIKQVLGVPELLLKFQIYRRQLKEDTAKTTCMVISCAKPEARVLQTKLMQAPQHALGKQVEFVPYQLKSIWSIEEYKNLFYQQNQYIQDVGAIGIQGITEDTMQHFDEVEQVTIQQFLLSHEKILSIEKSNTPKLNKWWIIVKKDHLQEVTKYLNTDMVQYMNMHTPYGSKQRYIPPKDTTELEFPNITEHKNVSNFSDLLKQRLQARPKPTPSLSQPPQTGRQRQTYAKITAKNINPNRIERETKVATQTQQKLQETKDTLEELTKAVSHIQTQITEPSTLTPSLQPEAIAKEIKKSSDQQMQHLAQEMKTMMQTMMQQFMQTITNLITTLIPTIIQSLHGSTQYTNLPSTNITGQTPPKQIGVSQQLGTSHTPNHPMAPNIGTGSHLSTVTPPQTV